MEKQKKNAGITLVALVVSIVVMLILAGVSINAVVGDNGIITQAQNAAIAVEEAELWEQIQMVLFDAYAQDLEGDKLVEYCNNRFNEQGLAAVMSIKDEQYLITYGINSSNIAYLDKELNVNQIVVAVVGSNEEWDYSMNEDGSITLTDYKKEKTGDIIIPNVIDGYLVTGLGDNIFRFATGLTSVTFNEGLATIGVSTFQNCTNLNCTIEFPSTLSSIGDYAFYYCANSTAGTSIVADLSTIVNQGIVLGKMAFAGCSGLTGNVSVLIDSLEGNVITAGMFSGFSGVTGKLVIPANITSIEENAFYGCSGITGLEFEDTTENSSQLTSIGKAAFSKCSSIANDLIIPSKVTSIGEYAFNECGSMTGLTLNSVITEIGQYAFYYCSSIAGTLYLPATMSTFNEYCFAYCSSVSEIIFLCTESREVTIGDCCFSYCAECSSVTLGSLDSVSVGFNAFFQCNALSEVQNGGTIKSIGDQAFWSDTSLEIISLDNCEKFGSLSMASTKITILPSQSNCSVISSRAFYGCSSLGYNNGSGTNIIEWLENSKVTSLGDDCFSGCTFLYGDLEDEILNSSGLTIAYSGSCFTSTSVTKVAVIDLEGDGRTVIAASEFAGITKFLDSSKNIITEITIPSNIEKIEEKAFQGCSGLTKIIIPASVKSIGSSAFASSSIETVKIDEESQITSIPYSCFWGSSVKYINFPDSITSIGASAFYNTNLTGAFDLTSIVTLSGSCFQGCKNMTEVTLGKNLEYIGNATFNTTGISEITVYDNCYYVGRNAFSTCYSLKTVSIGSGISSLPASLFSSDSSLTSVTFSGEITEIAEKAFYRLYKITNIKHELVQCQQHWF